MVRVIARISAKAGTANELRQILTDLVGPTRNEPGCVAYELLQDSESTLDFITFENWADTQAADAHLATTHVALAITKAGPFLAQPPVIHRFTPLA